jgi:hypothetical protein
MVKRSRRRLRMLGRMDLAIDDDAIEVSQRTIVRLTGRCAATPRGQKTDRKMLGRHLTAGYAMSKIPPLFLLFLLTALRC